MSFIVNVIEFSSKMMSEMVVCCMLKWYKRVVTRCRAWVCVIKYVLSNQAYISVGCFGEALVTPRTCRFTMSPLLLMMILLLLLLLLLLSHL